MSPHASEDPASQGRQRPSDATPLPARPAALTSTALLQGQRMVEIVHNGEVYRLQATRLGKLILTK